MKNSYKSFTNIIVIVLAVIAVISYIAWDRKLLPGKLVSENTEVETVKLDSSIPEGMKLYSNNVFSSLYPVGWVIDESATSSHGCNARVSFAQTEVPKEVFINEGTDYLHYLKNTGSVISIAAGTGEIKMSYEQLKKFLTDTEKDGRKIQLTFSQEQVTVTEHTLETESSTASLTYNFEFPQYNKKGTSKSIALNGKYPQLITVTYVAPAAEYSDEFFTTLVASVKSTLTSNSCDPYKKRSAEE